MRVLEKLLKRNSYQFSPYRSKGNVIKKLVYFSVVLCLGSLCIPKFADAKPRTSTSIFVQMHNKRPTQHTQSSDEELFNKISSQAQSFTFTGNGIVWEEDCTFEECFTAGESVDFSGTIGLVLDGFEVFWEINLEISEMGISETYEIGGDEGYIEVDDTGRFVNFSSWACWGCECDEIDSENPDECGSDNFSMTLNIEDLTGFINVDNYVYTEDERESDWWQLIGSVSVSQQ